MATLTVLVMVTVAMCGMKKKHESVTAIVAVAVAQTAESVTAKVDKLRRGPSH